MPWFDEYYTNVEDGFTDNRYKANKGKDYIIQMTPDGKIVAKFETLKQAANAIGTSQSQIWYYIRKQRPYRGFMWDRRLKDEWL